MELSIESLRDRAVKNKTVCGIYFLWKATSIIYVGQSVDCHCRLAEHRRRTWFDSFTIVECSKEELSQLETDYIKALAPELNMKDGLLITPLGKFPPNKSAQKPQDTSVEKLAFSVDEVCARVGFSRVLFYKMQAEGKGPRIMRVGKRVLISTEALHDWMRALEYAV